MNVIMKKGFGRDTEKQMKKLLRGRLVVCTVFLFCMAVLVSCKNPELKHAGIEIRINEQRTESGSVIQIPVFYSENEEIQKNLRSLEKETKSLEKTVRKELEKGTDMEMRAYPAEGENFPQVTVIWYFNELDTRVYNLVTLGADNRTGEPVTCKEALEKTEMSGVDLSLQVGRLAQESNTRGKLLSTEMQGFFMDEEGSIQEIYMKLIMLTGEGEEEKEEEHFYSYIIQEDRLIPLSERGYDIP